MTLVHKINAMLSDVPEWLIALFIRIAAAVPFWRSGRTKADGWDFWNVNAKQEFIFQTWELPLLSPGTWAVFASIGEHIFPVLLVLGLFGRLSGLALLGMTLVIQFLAVPDGWPTHILWAGLLLYVVARGPGSVSLDHLLGIEKKNGA